MYALNQEVFSESLFSLDSDPWELGSTTDFLTETCFPDSISSLSTDCDVPNEDPFQIDLGIKSDLPTELSNPPPPEVKLTPPVVIPIPQVVYPTQYLVPYKEAILPPAPVFFHPTMPMPPEEKKSTVCPQLLQDYDYFYPRSAPSFRTTPRLALDVSKPFSAAKYSEIFFQHASRLLVEKHPQLSENDLKQIEQTGFLYFMKNVKIIVPKIGPWRFLSHVRSGASNDRSYNLVGFPIRCKVKEWMYGGDLWRMYHFVKGKTPKARQL